MYHPRFFIAIILVWTGAALALSAPPAPIAPAATAPTRSAAPAKINWQKSIDQGKFQTFTMLAKALQNGTASPTAVQAVEFLVSEPARLERMRQWSARLDGPQRTEALRMLYAELMLADSDPDILYEHCIEVIDRTFEKTAKQPLKVGGLFSWPLGRAAMACIAGFEATRQERFLELVASSFERTLPFRDSELGRIDEVRGRAMHNWGTNSYAGEGKYGVEVCTSGRVTYPVARWVHIIRQDPNLREKYGERADRYLALIRQSLDEFEADYKTVPGTKQGYYLHLGRQLAEPVNHMSWAGNCLRTLHHITGEQKYGTMAEGVATFIRESMWEDQNGCLVWEYAPQPNQPHTKDPEWIWKAATTIDLPLYFADQATVFTEDDMRRIGKTFLTNIHRGEGRWNAWLKYEPNDLESRPRQDGGGLLCLTHYIELAKYEPRVRELIEEVVATRPDAGGWLRGSYAIMAYADRLKHSSFNAQRSAETLKFTEPSVQPAKPAKNKAESMAASSEE